jgi:hypothetical protein
MVSARGVLRTEGFPYSLDNGAWTAFQEHLRGERATAHPCLTAFRKAVAMLGSGADFIVIPDIVMGGAASWAMSRAWLRRLRRDPALRGTRLLIAVQNGMEPSDIERFLGPRVGVFVGGDTDWKLATMAQWSAVAHRHGAWCHVGRVNSARRARLCDIAGVDSFDGSGASTYEDALRRIDAAFDQRDIEGVIARAHPANERAALPVKRSATLTLAASEGARTPGAI